MVVIDVAMTETARLAHYVLPAASQFEKPEATFFNLEFPHNTFHLRHPLLEPLPGTLARAGDLGAAGAARSVSSTTPTCSRCAQAAEAGPRRIRARRSSAAVSSQPGDEPGAPVRSLRDAGPDAARRPEGRRRVVGAGTEDGDDLSRSGAPRRAMPTATRCSRRSCRAAPVSTFTVHEYEDDFELIAHADHKIALEMPEMLAGDKRIA